MNVGCGSASAISTHDLLHPVIASLQDALTAPNTLAVAVLAFVSLQRLAELGLARRNMRLLMAKGGVEVGRRHYPPMVVLHAGWLLGLWILAPTRSVNLPPLLLFALLQAARLWVLASLGERWTTRIIVVPGAPLVASGPYRFLRHPNYCIVAAEILVLPLAFGLVTFAVVFTLLNAVMLWVRIREEDAALRRGPASGARGPMTAQTISPAPSLGTWVAFCGLCVGMFMAVLDVQVVAASLPEIRTALGIRPDQMSWIQTSYLIAEVVAIPLTGLLTRALGLRRLAVLSITAFVVTSIGCAVSVTFGALLSWRLLQGLAGGLLIPQVFAAGFVLFPGRGQALATTLAGVLAVLAPTIGPFVGGWITDSFSWPWLFLINVAPGIAAIAAVARFLPRQAAELPQLRTFDFVGFGLMVIALACLEIALKEAPRAGWRSSTVLGLMAASLGAGALFVLRTWRVRQPIVDLRALADRDFALGCVLSFILGVELTARST